MQQHLYKFLILHRKLTIPQLGSFTIDHEPAHLDASSGLLFPPKPVIHFGKTVQPMSDRIFFNFLAEEMGVEEVTAIREFHNFSYAFRNDMQEHRQGLLPGLGRLTRGSDDGFFFTPESSLMELLPPIQLQDTQRVTNRITSKRSTKPTREDSVEENVDEQVEDSEKETTIIYKDRWWIPAIILLITGLVALFFYNP